MMSLKFKTLLIFIALMSLTSCAPGAFVSGYAYRSMHCDEAAIAQGLTPETESRIVDRAIAQMKLDSKNEIAKKTI
jgi:hypothetical protein